MAQLTAFLAIGTCTLALVMVQDFPNPASLPGGSKTGPPTDHSTYFTLLKVAQNVVQQCVQRRSEMGWQQAGMKITFPSSLSVTRALGTSLLRDPRASCELFPGVVMVRVFC